MSVEDILGKLTLRNIDERMENGDLRTAIKILTAKLNKEKTDKEKALKDLKSITDKNNKLLGMKSNNAKKWRMKYDDLLNEYNRVKLAVGKRSISLDNKNAELKWLEERIVKIDGHKKFFEYIATIDSGRNAVAYAKKYNING